MKQLSHVLLLKAIEAKDDALQCFMLIAKRLVF